MLNAGDVWLQKLVYLPRSWKNFRLCNKAQWKVTLLAQDIQFAPGNSQRASSTFHWLGIILGYFDPHFLSQRMIQALYIEYNKTKQYQKLWQYIIP